MLFALKQHSIVYVRDGGIVITHVHNFAHNWRSCTQFGKPAIEQVLHNLSCL